jgi:hypothetical protein
MSKCRRRAARGSSRCRHARARRNPSERSRVAASRRNGAKSRVPRTQRARRAAQDALKRGMRAQKHLVLPDPGRTLHEPATGWTPNVTRAGQRARADAGRAGRAR